MSDDHAHVCVYVEHDETGRKDVCWTCGRSMPRQAMTEDGRRRMGFSEGLTAFFQGHKRGAPP